MAGVYFRSKRHQMQPFRGLSLLRSDVVICGVASVRFRKRQNGETSYRQCLMVTLKVPVQCLDSSSGVDCRVQFLLE